MKKICIHWSAGSYGQCDTDFTHYHFTVGKDGTVLSGLFRPEANIPPLRNGYYAAHCGGGNSYCIGIALRGMAGFKDKNHVGKYPLTAVQCEAAWKKVAELCKRYGIAISPETVFTHREYGLAHPDSDSAGKIDICYLPHEPDLKPDQIGDYIRQKVMWYLRKLQKG